MLLYMIRHGESVANRERYYGSWMHVELTEKGIDDAKKAGEILQNIKFDKVYSSDLKRAVQTCEYALPGYEFEKTELLREVYVGTLMGENIDRCRDKYGDEYKNTLSTHDFDAFGGESRAEHEARVRKFLKILEDSPADNVAAFAHAGTIKRVYEFINGVCHVDLKCNNGGIFVFELENGMWSVKN